MAKRSSFPRIENDAYDTPVEAVTPLLRYLNTGTYFADLSAGDGALPRHLEANGHFCRAAFDIAPRAAEVERANMMNLKPVDLNNADCVIMNPPWDRKILHSMILHLIHGLNISAWLLIDTGWLFTQQAAPFLPYCSQIVTIGRVKWIPDSTMTGKDDACWIHVMPELASVTTFHGKRIKT